MDNVESRKFDLYKDIGERTGGEIYVGVIGPVRTGKSTFIKRIMDLLVLPNILEGPEKNRIKDELPQSGSGKTITTTEPKFLPKDAFELKLSEDVQMKFRLIDCVGYLVDGVVGHLEENQPRMVKTPWSDEKIPFIKAAEIGTQKVMQEHSTIGVVVTCDGSFSGIPRENYVEAEKRTILEMKKLGKPFVVILNSDRPYSEFTGEMATELESIYKVPVLPFNCEQLREEDVGKIFESILKEFPLTDIEFYVPKWVEMLPGTSELKINIINNIKQLMEKIEKVQDITPENLYIESPFIKKIKIESLNLSNGKVHILMEIDEKYYYEMLSKIAGEEIVGEHELVVLIKELAMIKKEYVKVSHAIDAVRQKGYGVVMPDKEEITLETPAIVKQGNKYGVKIKAMAPSIHMIRANIETEIAPIVGNENQATDLIKYISQSEKEEGSMWSTNIFGKSIEELVGDGIRSKLYQIGEESQAKLQDSMQKIVNDSNGGMICIII